ncbi:MAG: ABC transporter ATP-binding protein [Deltaproteobacteria bacterium]|nr:ABC transporter ATP-binding protein [Deltaproteobacteria bacterium]
MSLLQIKNCSLSFGGVKALQHFSAELNAGEILGIIGPNGAGKTTLFNILTGVYPPDTGEILFKNEAIQAKTPHQINHFGIARTFQNIRLFSELTVEDNVKIAFHQHLHSSLFQSAFQSASFLKEENEITRKTQILLSLFHLESRSEEQAKNLPYGDQRKLEIVRALATQPQLLLLDEPAAGMNRTEKKELVELILRIQKDFHLAILLIEHDMSVVMNLAPRIIVLDYGEKIAEGSPEEIRKNKKVIEAYLGTDETHPLLGYPQGD